MLSEKLIKKHFISLSIRCVRVCVGCCVLDGARMCSFIKQWLHCYRFCIFCLFVSPTEIEHELPHAPLCALSLSCSLACLNTRIDVRCRSITILACIVPDDCFRKPIVWFGNASLRCFFYILYCHFYRFALFRRPIFVHSPSNAKLLKNVCVCAREKES